MKKQKIVFLLPLILFTLVLALIGCATDYKPAVNLSAASTKPKQGDIKLILLEINTLVRESDFSGIKSISLADGGLTVGSQEDIIKWDDLDPRAEGSWFWDIFFPVGHCVVKLTNGNGHSYKTSSMDQINTGCGPNEQKFISLLVILKQAVRDDEQNDDDFEKAARMYRLAANKPSLPEEARKFKVQAEVAVRDKKFEDAAELYKKALGIAPWWPEGHFNRAIVLGESRYYLGAIREMKRYLIIVPNAPDARAAQDKIYEWELKTGK